MAASKKKIQMAYVASPLGFSEAGRMYYHEVLVKKLQALGLTLIDPWSLTPKDVIEKVEKMKFGEEQKQAWEKLNMVIGKRNAQGLDKADIVIAVLDGVDIDSGTACEIGYAAAKGKHIEGYRGDFRLSADNIGSTVNLQVEYFITKKGGKIATSLAELIENIRRNYSIERKKPKLVN